MTEPSGPAEMPLSALVARGMLGGVLMGLANLVPGISGGTMLLASGVYPQFVGGIAEVTTLRFRFRTLVLLAVVGVAQLLAIVLLAGLVKGLVVDHRWIMYSLFVGLTLGGVPILRGMIGRPGVDVVASAILGFVAMVGIAWVQAQGAAGGGGDAGFLFLTLAGVLGASAMILPGVSGGYLLLVLGVYVPILSAIDQVKHGLRALDPASLVDPVTSVVLPVGLGVVVGIAGVSHLLKWLLARFERPTLGVLVGLLLGAVVGLYPFQRPIPPALGSIVDGQVVTAENLDAIDPEDWPQEAYVPSAFEVAGALALAVAGYGITLGVSWVGREREAVEPATP